MYARAKKQIGTKVTTLHMHRMIMLPPDGMDVDHINGNGLDNRRNNLRICTRSQNHVDCESYNKRGDFLKGVTFCQKTQKVAGVSYGSMGSLSTSADY